MKLLLYFSNLMIPLLILAIVSIGISKKVKVYDAFVKGANEGLYTVVRIIPTLVGLMIATGILRASGFLDALSSLVDSFTSYLGFPGTPVPLTIVKMFSSSAATGLLLDIYKEFGTDSYIGLVASISMSCTETIFYTMSIYFMAARVTKTKYTLPAALLSTLGGLIASVILARFMI